MPQDHSTNVVVGWEGHRVKSVERIEPTGPWQRPRVEIVLERIARSSRCSGCGQSGRRVHEVTVRCVRDLPLFDVDTYV